MGPIMMGRAWRAGQCVVGGGGGGGPVQVIRIGTPGSRLSPIPFNDPHMRKSLLLLAIIPGTLVAQNPPPVKLINLPDATTKPIRCRHRGAHLPAALDRQRSGAPAAHAARSALGTSAIIADSVAGAANSYGTRPGGLIAYLGDSTLFIDPAGLSMFVIDPKGAIARVASVPRSQDANAFIRARASMRRAASSIAA